MITEKTARRGLAGLAAAGMATAMVTIAGPASAATEAVHAAASASSTPCQRATVSRDDVNIRTGPSTNYPVIGQVNTGAHLCMEQEVADAGDPDHLAWVFFHYHGRKAWIRFDFLTYG